MWGAEGKGKWEGFTLIGTRTRGVAGLVECLLSMHDALGFILSIS